MAPAGVCQAAGAPDAAFDSRVNIAKVPNMREASPPPSPPDLPRPRKIVNWKAGKKPGRRPTREGTWVEHRPRPVHDHRNPVFVTLRVKPDVPSLAGRKPTAAIIAGLQLAATANWERQKSRRRKFRVVHYAILPDKLELVVEATSAQALARGMQGLSSGLARRVNNQMDRLGSLFMDRYDARALQKPADLRKVLAYLQQGRDELPVVSDPHTALLQAQLKRKTA